MGTARAVSSPKDPTRGASRGTPGDAEREVCSQMAMFTFARRRPEVVPDSQEGGLSEAVRESLPLRFEAVGEALASGGDVSAACQVVGRDVARDGAALGEALSGLRTTYYARARRRPRVRRDRGPVGRLERGDAGVPPRPVLRGPADRPDQPRARAHPAEPRSTATPSSPTSRSRSATRWSSSRSGCTAARCSRSTSSPARCAWSRWPRRCALGLLRRRDHRPPRPEPRGGRRGPRRRTSARR